jgi:hypothetical protein
MTGFGVAEGGVDRGRRAREEQLIEGGRNLLCCALQRMVLRVHCRKSRLSDYLSCAALSLCVVQAKVLTRTLLCRQPAPM